jgi:hypothetical protein
MPLLTELENVLGCDSTKMSPLTELAVGVIFSGQIFYETQIQNCETKKSHARPQRKTCGDSGEVKYRNQKINDN